MTWSGHQPTIYRGEHANHYITDANNSRNNREQRGVLGMQCTFLYFQTWFSSLQFAFVKQNNYCIAALYICIVSSFSTWYVFYIIYLTNSFPQFLKQFICSCAKNWRQQHGSARWCDSSTRGNEYIITPSDTTVDYIFYSSRHWFHDITIYKSGVLPVSGIPMNTNSINNLPSTEITPHWVSNYHIHIQNTIYIYIYRYREWVYIYIYIQGVDVVEWSRALDVRLSEWCCSVSMVWVQIPSREEQKIDSSKI